MATGVDHDVGDRRVIKHGDVPDRRQFAVDGAGLFFVRGVLMESSIGRP